MKRRMVPILRAFSIIPLVSGFFFWLWSICCFYGGPDGHGGSAESIGFGLVFLLLTLLCGRLGYLLWQRNRLFLRLWGWSHLGALLLWWGLVWIILASGGAGNLVVPQIVTFFLLVGGGCRLFSFRRRKRTGDKSRIEIEEKRNDSISPRKQ